LCLGPHILFVERRYVFLAYDSLEGCYYFLVCRVFVRFVYKTPYRSILFGFVRFVFLYTRVSREKKLVTMDALTSNMIASWRLLWMLSSRSLQIFSSASAVDYNCVKHLVTLISYAGGVRTCVLLVVRWYHVSRLVVEE